MNRATTEAASQDEKATMEWMAAAVADLLKDHPPSLGLSVLAQMMVGNIGDEDLSDAVYYHRTVAALGLINLMRDGHAGREYDQAGFAESVHDLTSIVNCGSRALMVPALAATLVAAVANGRRNNQAEEACVADIRDALAKLEASLSEEP